MSDDNKLVTIYIDDVPHRVSSDNNLLAGVLSSNLNLPYFCWHPSMGSVGACRQCAVTQYQDENDTRGRLVMACTTPISDGMRISLADKHSTDFREQVIAAMMTNHPHDCPVCAEGGECHLQDMTVMTGHTHRDYAGSKRTFSNQNLGEFVGHEMNRCITCYRCVRYYKDYAGGKDFGVYGSKNQVYFGRQSDGALDSEFSGNLVEVCPTGVFTNKVFSAHFARKWDLQSAPSICAHCAIGCNTSVGERYGSVRRVVNRYNEQINGYFLCDRGRFGIGFVNGEQRIRQVKGIGQQSPEKLASLDVAKALVHFRGKRFLGIGSARASLEANFYLQHLVGKAQYSAGLPDNAMALAAQHKSLLAKYRAPSLKDIEQSDCIFVIGEDITHSSPRMALSVRQALRNASFEKAAGIGIPSWQDSAVRTIGGDSLSPLFSLQSVATKLDDVCEASLLLAPNEIAGCVMAINSAIASRIGQEEGVQTTPYIENLSEPAQGFVTKLLQAIKKAKRPLVVTGWGLASPRLLKAVGKLMATLSCDKFHRQYQQCQNTMLAILPPEANSVGVLSLLDHNSLSNEQLLERIEQGQFDGAIILEQELAQFTDGQLDKLRDRLDTLIVLEHSKSRVTELADIIMPVAAVTEGDGHLVNYQGLAQRYYQVHAPKLPIMDSWRWLNLLAKSIFSQGLGLDEHQMVNSMAELYDFFHKQQLDWPLAASEQDLNRGVARQTHRASGRTSQMANISVHEAKATQNTPTDSQCGTRLNFSMEGKPPSMAGDMPFTWAPGWNSNQSISQFQCQVSGALKKQVTTEQISFAASEEFIKAFPVDDENYLDGEQGLLQLVTQRPWFKQDWQSAHTPEFGLMSEVNRICISPEQARQQGWQQGQFIKVSAIGFERLAQVSIDKKLPNNLCYGVFDTSDNQVCQAEVQLSLPSDKEIAHYQQGLSLRISQARAAQTSMLERLKQSDQYVPIRLVSGGLDDA